MEITRLILKNFRSHRSSQFEFNAGVTGIIGGNGSGKSSIVEAVIFLLTGEGYGKTKSDMLTVGQTSGYVIGHLVVNGKEAVLERHIDTAKVNFMYEGKTYKKSSEVNEIWDSLFQIDKNIVQNVIVSNQGEIALLFNGDNATREKLFQKIFMVPNTTKIRDVIWNNYIKDAPPEYPVKDMVKLTSDIQCLEKLIELGSEELEQISVNEGDYDTLVARKSFLSKVKASRDSHKLLAAELEDCLSRSASLDVTASTLRSKMQLINVQDYRAGLAEQKAAKTLYDTKQLWESRKKNLSVPSVQIDKVHVAALRKQETEWATELTAKRNAVIALNRKMEEYGKSGLASGTCPTCGTQVDNVKKLIEHIEKEREPLIEAGKEQKARLLEVTEELRKSQEQLDVWESYERELQTIDSALAAYNNVSFDQEEYTLCESVVAKYSEWETRLSILTADYREAESATQSKRLQIAGLVTYDRDPVEFTSEEIAVSAKIDDMQKSREAAKKLEVEVATNKRELKSLNQDLQDNNAYVDKNNKRKEYVGVLKGVYDLFHTGRFPRALIQTYSSTVTEYMNEVLASFDFPYTAKVNETFGIDVFNEEGLQLPAISGGQQVMVGFSLRLALHNMFVGAFPFMIIDEGSYGLNSDNAKKYFEIIKTLGKSSKFKQVIVIDHHSELSEYVDNTISL
jgi:DNA repair exonuclease SbcCD ATPase subunit